MQIAGLGNVVGGMSKGVQIGGFFNVDQGSFDGVQISGVFNSVSEAFHGVQVSLLVNRTRGNFKGVQIAGLLNYTPEVDGLQLGLINVSRRVIHGTPIGIFSYSGDGYHLFELSANEIFYGNAAFKSGIRAFYNFVQLGIGAGLKLQASYGIGSTISLGRSSSVSIDASAGFVYHPADTVYHGMLLKFVPSYEYRFSKHFAIFGGPAYNFFLFPKGTPSATSRGLSPYDFYFRSTEKAWIGGVAGVRF